MLLGAVLVLGVYVASYFACVHTAMWVGLGGVDTAYPGYRFFPASARWVEMMYRPIHHIDRFYLRPAKWEKQGMATRATVWP